MIISRNMSITVILIIFITGIYPLTTSQAMSSNDDRDENTLTQTGQNDAGTGEDASDGFNNSISVNTDEIYTGTIGSAYNGSSDQGYDRYDNYIVTLLAQGYLLIETNYTSLGSSSLYLTVYTVNTDEIWSSKSGNAGVSGNVIKIPIISYGIYYIRYETSGSDIIYDFLLSHTRVTLPSQNDAGSGVDAGHSFTNALFVESNSTVEGGIGQGLLESQTGGRDELDYYRYRAINAGLMKITVQLELSLADASGIFFDLKDERDLIEFSLMEMYIDPGESQTSSICLEEGAKYYFSILSLDNTLIYNYTVVTEYTEGTPAVCPDPNNELPLPVLPIITTLISTTLILKKRRIKLSYH